eukprot:gene9111-biopygen10176
MGGGYYYQFFPFPTPVIAATGAGARSLRKTRLTADRLVPCIKKRKGKKASPGARVPDVWRALASPWRACEPWRACLTGEPLASLLWRTSGEPWRAPGEHLASLGSLLASLGVGNSRP